MSHTMNTDPHKVKAIFLEVVEKHAADGWDSFLAEACGDDADLRRQVEILLDAHKRAGTYLEHGAIEGAATIDQPITEKPGTQIGPYKLLQQLGEGGMGVVYMADSEMVARAAEYNQATHEALRADQKITRTILDIVDAMSYYYDMLSYMD